MRSSQPRDAPIINAVCAMPPRVCVAARVYLRCRLMRSMPRRDARCAMLTPHYFTRAAPYFTTTPHRLPDGAAVIDAIAAAAMSCRYALCRYAPIICVLLPSERRAR